MVLLEEFDEYELELGAEVCPNLDFVVQIVGMDADIVQFVYAWLIRLWMLNRGRL